MGGRKGGVSVDAVARLRAERRRAIRRTVLRSLGNAGITIFVLLLLWQAIIGAWPASRERLHAYAEKASREHAATLRGDLTALQQAREDAASAGMLRRRGAKRAAAEAEERFVAAHGSVPEDGVAETWVQATAAAAACA